MMHRCYHLRSLVTVIAVILGGVSGRAQVANNTVLVGNVVDPAGLPVAGAKVTAVNEETKVVYPGKTNGDGYYSIAFIVPGTYDVTVDSPGFVVLKKTGQVVSINASVR